MDLSATHIHLLLNHFPTIGFIMGLTLYVAGLYAKSDHVKQAALVVFVGIALITIPTYCTGNAAAERLCIPARDNPNVCADTGLSRTLIETHEGAAYLSLAFMIVTGGFAWLGLWQYRRIFRIARWNSVVILVMSVVTLGLVSRAANLGGEIRHPEIRLTQEVAAGGTQPLGRLVGNFIRDTPWTWVTSETLHFVGLCILLGGMITQWPYLHGCGLPLLEYFGAITMVIVAGGWIAVASWTRRHAPSHVLALLLIVWGMALAAYEILPRVGYAAQRWSWQC